MDFVLGSFIAFPVEFTRPPDIQGVFWVSVMEPLVPSTPGSTKLSSEVNNSKPRSEDLGLGSGASFKKGMAVEETRVNDEVTMVGSSMDKAIFAEAPVTPFADRENARSSVTNLTPLTSISSATRKSDFGDFCYDEGTEWNEKVAEEPCGDAETPEHSTFDPFASGPEELIFAPKKSHKPQRAYRDFHDDDDGHVPSHNRSRPIGSCNVQKSKLSVARTLCFEGCLDSEDENHSLGLNSSTVPSSANTDQCDSLASTEPVNQSSQSKSRAVRVLDLHYENQSSPGAHSTDAPVNDNDRHTIFPGDDASNEETFIKSMFGSFLEVIISKQCEDAKVNISDGGVKDVSCYGSDQHIPSTPVTPYKGFSRAINVCPGAPVKASPKPRLRGAALGSVCRKLEF